MTFPSALENLVFIQFELCVMLWLPLVWGLYHALPWLFGPEAVAPFPGRRRVNMLLGVVASSFTVLTVLFLGESFLHGAWAQWRFRLVDFVHWYAGSDLAASDFQRRALLCGLTELCGVLIVLMGVKLYGKGVCGRTSEAERSGGLRGLIAWVDGPNLVWATALIACVATTAALFTNRQGRTDVIDAAVQSGSITALLAFAALAAYPIGRSFGDVKDRPAHDGETTRPPSIGSADLSSERQRVLRLLEDGRITADEAAELLSALAATVTPEPTSAVPWTRSRKLILGGAMVVLVGFFLPWFLVSPTAVLEHAMGMPANSIASGFPSELLSQMRVNGQPVPMPAPGQPMIVSVSGGDVGNGLGWIVLVAAMASAAVPFMATGLSAVAQRNVTWVSTAGASVITLYLMIAPPVGASIGVYVVAIGLGLQWAGLLADLPRRSPLAYPVTA